MAKNWHEAREICEAEGTHLVIINSEDEFNAIRRNPMNLWTGVNDIQITGNYVTIFCKYHIIYIYD